MIDGRQRGSKWGLAKRKLLESQIKSLEKKMVEEKTISASDRIRLAAKQASEREKEFWRIVEGDNEAYQKNQ